MAPRFWLLYIECKVLLARKDGCKLWERRHITICNGCWNYTQWIITQLILSMYFGVFGLTASGALRCGLNNGGCWRGTQEGKTYSACIVSASASLPSLLFLSFTHFICKSGCIFWHLVFLKCLLTVDLCLMDFSGWPINRLQVSTRIQGWWSQHLRRYRIISLSF